MKLGVTLCPSISCLAWIWMGVTFHCEESGLRKVFFQVILEERRWQVPNPSVFSALLKTKSAVLKSWVCIGHTKTRVIFSLDNKFPWVIELNEVWLPPPTPQSFFVLRLTDFGIKKKKLAPVKTFLLLGSNTRAPLCGLTGIKGWGWRQPFCEWRRIFCTITYFHKAHWDFISILPLLFHQTWLEIGYWV